MPIGNPDVGGYDAGAGDAGSLGSIGSSSAPLVGAGLSILGNVIGAVSQGHQNKVSRQFALDMYNRQRADSLSDWAMQNEYNSPAALMARYRKAGLNENLIYGNGTNASASTPRASSAPSWSPHPLDFHNVGASVGDAVMQIYDVKLKEAQTDNVRAATTAQLEDVNLKKVQEIATLSGSGKSNAETQEILARLPYVSKLAETDVNVKQANVGKTLAETSSILTHQELDIASTSMSLQEAAQRILTMRMQNSRIPSEINELKARISNLDQDTRIKKADADLKAQGVQPHDALWQRKLADLIQNLTGSVPGFKHNYGTVPGMLPGF